MKLNLRDKLIGCAEVQKLLGDPPPHRSTIWRWVRDQKLPAPVSLGDNTLRWWQGEIIAYREALPRQTYRAPEPASRTPRSR
jgi:predicted DNA-binding transcriptional regulator AlpA